MKKPWGGRFSGTTDSIMEQFSQSISFDKRLYAEDIEGSIAHAAMLMKQKILSEQECGAIIKGLRDIQKEIESGSFVFNKELEDIHMAIESRLKEKIGGVAGKLHTARSRNDQVALDTRLYLKKIIPVIYKLLQTLQQVFVLKAAENLDAPMPGYTHLQRAQPVLVSHYLLAYVEMWERDKGRLFDCYRRLDLSPLGSGALAGTTFPINREFIAKKLGFSGTTGNSMDAVSDRDFVIEFLAASSLIMMHCSRLCEDMIIWSSHEFRYVILPDGFCTGSSIMPQKKNPDALELVRGKTGRIYGSLIAMLTIMKSLPLAYNRDMQEDKEQLFDAVDTVTGSLKILVAMFPSVTFNVKRMQEEAKKGFLLATEVADYLTKKGLPFRQAHEITGKIVAYCEKAGKDLNEMKLEEYKKFSQLFAADIFKAVSLDHAVNARKLTGGTGRDAVKKRLTFWMKRLKRSK